MSIEQLAAILLCHVIELGEIFIQMGDGLLLDLFCLVLKEREIDFLERFLSFVDCLNSRLLQIAAKLVVAESLSYNSLKCFDSKAIN